MRETGVRKRLGLLQFLAASVVVALIVCAVVLNFETLKDIVVGVRYRPTPEMETLRASLNLTDRGQRIFNATMPELKEKEDFNQICREAADETAILGCYRDEKIYVYNIQDEELAGIRELTTAHELLHAVYGRLSASEREKWAALLGGVYETQREVLAPEIEIYPADQQAEELYVRVGTEIADLPFELEAHYGEIFRDQDGVVRFYQSYITVFKEVEKRMETLRAEMERMSGEIATKSDEYKNGAAALNAEVEEFNACAKEPNCFSSSWEFSARRAELTGRQEALASLYETINGLVAQYNALVNEYNENVLHGQTLERTINSL